MKYHILFLEKSITNNVSAFLINKAFLFSYFDSKALAQIYIDILITNKYNDFKSCWSWTGKEYLEHNKFVKYKSFISKDWTNITNTSLISVFIFSNKILNEYKKLDNYFNCLVSDFNI